MSPAPAFGDDGEGAPAPRWWKGNTHTHTLNSDGDASPGEVAHWYRDHDYDFLCLSDHNYRTDVAELQRELDREVAIHAKKRMLLIPGEEVTDRKHRAEIHVNGLDTRERVGKQGGETKHDVLQRSIDAIRKAGGLPSVNHPNYMWSITADDLARLEGLRHFEIYNGHPGVHNWGGGGYPSLEQMWDDLLTRGLRMYGMAVDDAHDYRSFGPRYCNPGKGWIVVRAPELEAGAIRAAIEAGEFYASTGVILGDIRRDEYAIRVRIEPEMDGDREDDAKFTTEFIGPGGKVLAREVGLESAYSMTPDDRYVRVRVTSSRQEYAWSQPFWLEDAEAK